MTRRDGDDEFSEFFQFDGAADPMVEADQHGPEHAVTAPPRLGLLATLSSEEFDIVARSSRLTLLEQGQQVFAQGDRADRFYILIDGEVTIERDGEAINTLGPGSFFGEGALLTGGQRSATVRAATGTSLWSVGYDAFTAAISVHLLANADVRAVIEARLRGAAPDST